MEIRTSSLNITQVETIIGASEFGSRSKPRATRRGIIGERLNASMWAIQNYTGMSFVASQGVAAIEYPTAVGWLGGLTQVSGATPKARRAQEVVVDTRPQSHRRTTRHEAARVRRCMRNLMSRALCGCDCLAKPDTANARF